MPGVVWHEGHEGVDARFVEGAGAEEAWRGGRGRQAVAQGDYEEYRREDLHGAKLGAGGGGEKDKGQGANKKAALPLQERRLNPKKPNENLLKEIRGGCPDLSRQR